MHGQPGRLVHDDHRLVLVDDAEVQLLGGLPVEPRRPAGRDDDVLAADEGSCSASPRCHRPERSQHVSSATPPSATRRCRGCGTTPPSQRPTVGRRTPQARRCPTARPTRSRRLGLGLCKSPPFRLEFSCDENLNKRVKFGFPFVAPAAGARGGPAPRQRDRRIRRGVGHRRGIRLRVDAVRRRRRRRGSGARDQRAGALSAGAGRFANGQLHAEHHPPAAPGGALSVRPLRRAGAAGAHLRQSHGAGSGCRRGRCGALHPPASAAPERRLRLLHEGHHRLGAGSRRHRALHEDRAVAPRRLQSPPSLRGLQRSHRAVSKQRVRQGCPAAHDLSAQRAGGGGGEHRQLLPGAWRLRGPRRTAPATWWRTTRRLQPPRMRWRC